MDKSSVIKTSAITSGVLLAAAGAVFAWRKKDFLKKKFNECVESAKNWLTFDFSEPFDEDASDE